MLVIPKYRKRFSIKQLLLMTGAGLAGRSRPGPFFLCNFISNNRNRKSYDSPTDSSGLRAMSNSSDGRDCFVDESPVPFAMLANRQFRTLFTAPIRSTRLISTGVDPVA